MSGARRNRRRWIPKQVSSARECLQKAGLPVTGANLKKAIPTKDFNSLSACFRSKLSKEAKATYTAIRSDEERRAWLAQFVLDPATCSMHGVNKTTAFVETTNHEEDEWLTFEELCDKVKSEKSAMILIKNNELETRPSRWPSLAAEGVLEYHYWWARGSKKDGTREEAGTEARAELTADEYTQVCQDVSTSVGQPIKRKAIKQKVLRERF